MVRRRPVGPLRRTRSQPRAAASRDAGCSGCSARARRALPLVVQATCTAVVAVILLAASFEGYLWRLGTLPFWSRTGFGVAGLLMFIPEFYTDLIGAALALAVGLLTWMLARGRPVVG